MVEETLVAFAMILFLQRWRRRGQQGEKLIEEKSGCVQYFRKKLEEYLHVFYHTILDKFEPLQQVLLDLDEPHQGLLRHVFQLHSSRHIENSAGDELGSTILVAL